VYGKGIRFGQYEERNYLIIEEQHSIFECFDKERLAKQASCDLGCHWLLPKRFPSITMLIYLKVLIEWVN
jgi:hypothetical protein